MPITSSSRRRLYERVTQDMQSQREIRVSDYEDELAYYNDFPSGTKLVNPMVPILTYLATPDSIGVRTELGLTTNENGVMRGAVVRIRHGVYRWFQHAEWVNARTLSTFQFSDLSCYQSILDNNSKIRMVDAGPPAQRFTFRKDKTPTAAMLNTMPAPTGTPVLTIPPPVITAPVCEIIGRDGQTIIIKTDDTIIVATINTEVPK